MIKLITIPFRNGAPNIRLHQVLYFPIPILPIWKIPLGSQSPRILIFLFLNSIPFKLIPTVHMIHFPWILQMAHIPLPFIVNPIIPVNHPPCIIQIYLYQLRVAPYNHPPNSSTDEPMQVCDISLVDDPSLPANTLETLLNSSIDESLLGNNSSHPTENTNSPHPSYLMQRCSKIIFSSQKLYLALLQQSIQYNYP